MDKLVIVHVHKCVYLCFTLVKIPMDAKLNCTHSQYPILYRYFVIIGRPHYMFTTKEIFRLSIYLTLHTYNTEIMK